MKVPGRRPSNNPQSALYIKDDSWLADFDSLRKAYAEQFGTGALNIINYDAELAQSGDVLPALLRAVGLPERFIPPPGSTMRINQNSFSNRIRQLGHKGFHYLRACIAYATATRR